MASGKAAVMASGKPFRPSTTAIRMSWVPRFFSSFITDSQNLAPSFSAIQRPRTSRWPSRVTPKATYTALFLTVRLSASRSFTRSASKITIGYIRSSARLCHSRTSSRTASVTRLIRSGETFRP